MTPLHFLLPRILPKGTANATSAKSNPLNTNTLTLPSITTPAVSTTTKCLKCLTPPITPPPPDQPQHPLALLTWHHPTALKTWPSPLTPNSPTLLPLSSYAMTDSSQKNWYSTSHTPPHPQSKRYRHPHSKYASTRHRMASPTPPCPLAQLKLSFTSVEMNLQKSHTQWPMDSPLQWNDTPPSLPSSSPPLAPASTTLQGLLRPTMKRSTAYGPKQGTLTCCMTSS
jgi:hypothetical protein